MSESHIGVTISIGLIKVSVFIYDIITLPLYAICQWPWRNKKKDVKETKIVGGTEGITYRCTRAVLSYQIEIERNHINTIQKMHDYCCDKYGDKNALGSRKVLSEYNEVQKNGKVFKKYDMGDYTWLTYKQANEKAKYLGRGFRAIGHQTKENIMVLSETRVEWFLSAMAAFKQNMPLCTLYATLGIDGLAHGINETEVRRIVISHDLLPKFKAIRSKCPKVEEVIYLPDPIHETDTSDCPDIKFYSFDEIIEKGKSFSGADSPPLPSDTAIIMYTSGSTGTPKGVVQSHMNLMTSMMSFANCLRPNQKDLYLAYLPLAHVMELIGESLMMLFGVSIGYSSPLTMTDRSTKVKRGCKGDVSVLHPTIIPAVPLILDRIYKGILEKVASQGPFLKALFDFGVKYKMDWYNRGWGTPICNWFVFRKIRALLGGRCRMIVGGSAPLSSETHQFVRESIGCAVLQGYGLTETCSSGTMMDLRDRSTGNVGIPLFYNDVKLIDWDEGNYRIKDRPNPRGEILIGGDNVAVGYYKNEAKTAEDFVMADGRRWFKTGDIGEFDDRGVLTIIDRKKDLVKLQMGEYVSLGKVEAGLKICPLVENLCLFADSLENNTVLIMSPNPAKLAQFAASVGWPDDKTFEELCADRELTEKILKEIVEVAKRVKLEKYEIPTALHLTAEHWTPESGLVTAAFKLKRIPIRDHYQKQIDAMYRRRR